MGVVLTIHQMDTSSDEVHMGCEHDGAYWTWYVSSDGEWLVCKRFRSGPPRTQVPMRNIRALVMAMCPRDQGGSMPNLPGEGPPHSCQCGEITFYGEEDVYVETLDGRTHRARRLGDVLCDRQVDAHLDDMGD